MAPPAGKDPYRYFRLEARELMDQFAATVLELEKGDAAAVPVQRLLRLAHTLKGAARVVKQAAIADGAHAIEEVLAPLRDAAEPAPRAAIDAVLGRLDGIEEKLRALTVETPTAPAPVTPGAPDRPVAPSPAPETARTIRTEIAEIDALIDGAAETHALLGGLRGAAQAVERAHHLAEMLAAQLAAAGESVPPRTATTADELLRAVGGLERSIASSVDQMDRELRELRESAEQLRLAAAETLFTPLERTALDAARELGRTVSFAAQGGAVRLDAGVLATVQNALVQVVRNAVAHGIEPPEERRARGKKPTGQIALDVSRRGGRILFTCRDDGRGLDLDAVRRRAVERGLPAAEAARLGVEALVRLLLRGGISTAAAVTSVAGRGVGLDVVRAAADQLGGDVAVKTVPGGGTSITLDVPASLAALEALVVEAGGTEAAIPLDAVRRATRVAPHEFVRDGDSVSVVDTVAGAPQAVPFVPLATLVFGARAVAGRAWSTIVVDGAAGPAALGVDRLLGTSRIVVRPLPALAPAGAIVAGVWLDAEGNPQLVLDPDGLAEAARLGAAGALGAPAPRNPVLVVDDSLTTRMLEQSILESAGYEVDLANSAEEGLVAVRRKRYAVVLVDVEMPGMDGFGFVASLRADPVLHDLPAILVSSRAAPEDLQRGRDVGAQGYVAKGEFDQAVLLDMIRPLAG